MARAPTFSDGSSCHSASQLCPASTLRQTPPPAAPAQSRSAAVGWQITQVIRPPMFAGPTGDHWSVPGAGCTSTAARARSRVSRPTGGSRRGHDSRAWNQALRTLWVLTRYEGPSGGAFRGRWVYCSVSVISVRAIVGPPGRKTIGGWTIAPAPRGCRHLRVSITRRRNARLAASPTAEARPTRGISTSTNSQLIRSSPLTIVARTPNPSAASTPSGKRPRGASQPRPTPTPSPAARGKISFILSLPVVVVPDGYAACARWAPPSSPRRRRSGSQCLTKQTMCRQLSQLRRFPRPASTATAGSTLRERRPVGRRNPGSSRCDRTSPGRVAALTRWRPRRPARPGQQFPHRRDWGEPPGAVRRDSGGRRNQGASRWASTTTAASRSSSRPPTAGWSGCCLPSCTTRRRPRTPSRTPLPARCCAGGTSAAATTPRPGYARSPSAGRSTTIAATRGGCGPCCGWGRHHPCRRSALTTSTWCVPCASFPWRSGRCWSCTTWPSWRWSRSPPSWGCPSARSRAGWCVAVRRWHTTCRSASQRKTRRAPMRDEELRSRLRALAVAGQAAPNPAAIAAVRRRVRRKVQGGVVVVLVGLLLAGVGVRLGSEAVHRRSVGPAPVVTPPAGPPAAVAPKTFVGQVGNGSARQTVIIDAGTGRIVREVPGSKRQTGMAVDAVLSPDLRSMYLPDTGSSPTAACGSRWTQVDLATGARRPAFGGLTGVGQFSLSADGSSVAFAHTTPARTGAIVGPSCHAEELVVRELASGEQRVWTIPPGVSLDGLQLSPDATQLAYLLRRDSAGLQPSLHLLPLKGTTSVTQGRDLPTTGDCPMSDPRFVGASGRLLALGGRGCATGPLEYLLVEFDLGTGRVASSMPLGLPGEIFSIDVDRSGQHVIIAGAGKPNDQLPATVWVLRDGHPQRVPFSGDCWQADW